MQLERFGALLDAYGARESAWPVEERTAMLRLLEEDAAARQLVQDTRDFDLLLNSFEPELPDLTDSIVAAVPESLLDRFLHWLWPQEGSQWWHPALASALPLVLGVAIGISQPQADPLIADGDDWELQERQLLLPATDGASGGWYE